MIKIFAVVIVLLVVAVLALLAFAATRPSSFALSRSTTIRAPAEKIFPLIADFHRWIDWSPYEKLDPAMTRRHEGAASGKGAAYAWSGNRKAGAGRMEIVDLAAPRQVDIQLDFVRPMEGRNLTEFVLAPEGDATRVTWRMSGPSPYLARLAGVIVDMDKLIGRDFETGLASLKTIAER